MHVDALNTRTVYIPAGMRALVNDKASLAGLLCPVSEGGAEKAGTDNQVVVGFH